MDITFGLCIWGKKNIEISIKNKVNDYFNSYKTPVLIFNVKDDDINKSLWLTNNEKRQHELATRKLFKTVIYIHDDYVDKFISLNSVMQTPNFHTIYLLDRNFYIFYCDSMSGDLASMYRFNIGNKDSFDQDFKYHLYSYNLNLRKYKI